MKQDAGKVEEVLRTGGFSKPSSPVQKIPEEYKKDLEAEIAKAQEQAKQLESELAECAGSRQDLELISDYYRTRAEKYRILGEIPQTASTFAKMCIRDRIGTMPNPQDQQSILNLLAGAVPDVEAVDVELISTDKDFTYLAVICICLLYTSN